MQTFPWRWPGAQPIPRVMIRVQVLAVALTVSAGCAGQQRGSVGGGAEATGTESEGGASGGSAGGSSSGGTVDLPPLPTSLEDTLAIYGAAWGEQDPIRRRALLELVWADDGIYRDPTVVAEGRDALVEAIGEFHQSLPGATLELADKVESFGNFVRFDWSLQGPVDSPGTDFGELDDDGRLLRIVGFFGPQPTDTPVPEAVQAYLDAWNAPDDATRAQRLADAVTPSIVYRDPTTAVAGPEALSAYIESTRATVGDAPLLLSGTPDAYGPVMRFTWTMGDPIVVAGIDFATVADDGRLAEITGFFGG